jgi:hypothetical protein
MRGIDCLNWEAGYANGMGKSEGMCVGRHVCGKACNR